LANNKDFGKVEWVEEKVSGKKSWKKHKTKGVIDNLNNGDRISSIIVFQKKKMQILTK